MSSTFRNTPAVTLLSQTVSSATPVNSTAFNTQASMITSVQVTWTSTLAATFTIQASLDGTNWASTGVTLTAASGTAGSSIANIPDNGYQFIRVQTVQSASSGVVTVLASSKCV